MTTTFTLALYVVLTAGADSSPSKTADNPNDGRCLSPACREAKK